jgi:hypothetical protein
VSNLIESAERAESKAAEFRTRGQEQRAQMWEGEARRLREIDAALEADRAWLEQLRRSAERGQPYEPKECPGHVDDDWVLLSGAGIGEALYCDGSCQG